VNPPGRGGQWCRNEFESKGHRSGAKAGGTDPAQSAEKKFLVVPLHFFGSKSTISRFGEHFRDGQYIQFGQFLVCCSSTHGAPVPHGVGATGRGAPQFRHSVLWH